MNAYVLTRLLAGLHSAPFPHSGLLSSPDPRSGDSVLFLSISRVLNFTRDFFFDVFVRSLFFNLHVLMDFLVLFLLFFVHSGVMKQFFKT